MRDKQTDEPVQWNRPEGKTRFLRKSVKWLQVSLKLLPLQHVCPEHQPLQVFQSQSFLFQYYVFFISFILSISSFREGVEYRQRSQIDTRYAGVNDGLPFPRRLGAGSNDPKGSISYDPVTRMPAIPQKRWEAYATNKM